MATRTVFPVKREHDCVLLPSGPLLVRPTAPPNGVYRCNVCGRLWSVKWTSVVTGEGEEAVQAWRPNMRSITYEQALDQVGPEPWEWQAP